MRDAIVIGAGGGGPVIAKELAARGLDVLLLEAGARFASPENEWSHFDNDAGSITTGYFRFGPASRNKGPWLRDLPPNSLLQQIAGVGGTTKHYFGNSPRAMPGAFMGYNGADRDAYDTEHLFPFSYRDLIPYYEWVEEILPVETAPMGTKEEVFFRGAETLGIPVQTTKDTIQAAYRPQENAILQPQGVSGKTADPRRLVFPQAQGCTFCGHCIQGCYQPLGAPRNMKAKRSTDNSYIPMALTAQRWARGGRAITLIADAFVTRIHTDSQNTAKSVTWRVGASGNTVTEDAKVIVLAAGPVESPRLWLNSGLPNPNDWVGRGFTDHFIDVVVAKMPFYTGSSKGPASAARADYPGRGCFQNLGATPGTQAGASGLSDAGIAGFYNTGLPNTQGADSVGRVIGPELKSLMADIDRGMGLLIFTDDDVQAVNRVRLSSGLPPDEHGPIPRVEVFPRARTARTLANREFLVEQAVKLLRGAGATKVYRFNSAPFLVHMHSTLRMGTSAGNSVLDANAEARWVKRLFVTDNSALANALGGPNPTLTMQALATRTAEKIFEIYFGGTGWVRRESPVSSTDARISRCGILACD